MGFDILDKLDAENLTPTQYLNRLHGIGKDIIAEEYSESELREELELSPEEFIETLFSTLNGEIEEEKHHFELMGTEGDGPIIIDPNKSYYYSDVLHITYLDLRVGGSSYAWYDMSSDRDVFEEKFHYNAHLISLIEVLDESDTVGFFTKTINVHKPVKYTFDFSKNANSIMYAPGQRPKYYDIDDKSLIDDYFFNLKTKPLYTSVKKLYRYNLISSWLVLIPDSNKESADGDFDKFMGYVAAEAAKAAATSVAAIYVGPTIAGLAVSAVSKAVEFALDKIIDENDLEGVIKIEAKNKHLNRKVSNKIPITEKNHSKMNVKLGEPPELWAFGIKYKSSRFVEPYTHVLARQGPNGYGTRSKIATNIQYQFKLRVRYLVRRSRNEAV